MEDESERSVRVGEQGIEGDSTPCSSLGLGIGVARREEVIGECAPRIGGPGPSWGVGGVQRECWWM
jgi:hypothetical protein